MINSLPQENVWQLTDKDDQSQFYGRELRFDFSYAASDEIKELLQHYVWHNYRTKSKTLWKLYCDVSDFKHFNEFASSWNLRSLKNLDNDHISMYISSLRTKLSKVTKKPLAYQRQKKCFDVVKTIIRWGQLHMPDYVPETEIFIGNEYPGVNDRLRIEFIPDDIVFQIEDALKNEENPYVKCGIILLQSSGVRIGDLLLLTTDCVEPHAINGYTLTWYDHKNRKERKPLPIPDRCAEAVKTLIQFTEPLREHANNDVKQYIFIHQMKAGLQKGMVRPIQQLEYRNLLLDFAARHDIKDGNGDIFRIKPHQFRRTLATDMLSKGTNIKVIQEVLGHTAVSTTKMHYSDVKDKERAEQFSKIGIIGHVNQVDKSVIPDADELKWFQENREAGAKMCDGYCTKPFKNGIVCDRLLKRQKCYSCSRYITTPEYLEFHKNHLKTMEEQLENNVYGHHYAEHFHATIQILREIIVRLEEIRHD